MALDWTMDLAAQARAAHVDLGKVDLVLAAECVWLQELVTPPPTHMHTHTSACGRTLWACCRPAPQLP